MRTTANRLPAKPLSRRTGLRITSRSMSTTSSKRPKITHTTKLSTVNWGTRITVDLPPQSYGDWERDIVVKELVDNALDAAEEAEIAPVVSITVKGRSIIIQGQWPRHPGDERPVRDVVPGLVHEFPRGAELH